eukprot:gene21431-27461_t
MELNVLVRLEMESYSKLDNGNLWEVPEPFVFNPSSGTIRAGQHHDIVVTIRPEDASVFVAQAICHVGTGVHAIIPEPILLTKLSAIGKYAYIALTEKMVSFEEVTSGTRPERKEVVLQNNSVVPAEFELVRFDTDRDEVFDIYPKSGVILPRSEVTVTVQFNALAMGCFSLDRYVFRTPGNCSTMLICKGMTMPPRVLLYKEVAVTRSVHANATDDLNGGQSMVTTLSNGLQFNEGSPEFSLNFRDVEVGRVETRILFLQNDSARDVPYSVIADENGIFQMHPKQGVIPSKSSSYAIKVIFSPPKPNNYYRRFFVLVGDSLPLFYDCLGTGFIRSKGEIKEQRPAPLRHAHVQAYRNRSVQGMGVLGPDELDSMYSEGEAVPQYFAQIGRTGTRAMSVTTLQRPVTRTGESVRTNVAPAHEFFISDADARSKEVTLNKTTLDFGYTGHGRTSDVQNVTLFNHTHAKVVVQWQIPVVNGMDVAKGSATSSKDRQIITGDSAERELALLQAFSVFPLTAEINPGKSASFEVTFVPKQSNRNFICELEAYVYFKNQRTFRLVNDHSMTPPWCLKVASVGHTFGSGQLLAKARVLGGNITQGKLVFPCCYEGESIYQTFMLRNTSNLPSTFRIELGWGEDASSTGAGASSDKEIFSVKPDVGEVDAENFVLICVRFSPKASRKYIQLVRCIINGESGGKLMLEGAGATPFVILPDLLSESVSYDEQSWGISGQAGSYIPKGFQGAFYLKPTCVGLSNTRKVTLKNGSRLPLRFKLSLSASANGVVSISPMSGILKGNEDAQVTISFAPRKSVTQQYKLQISVYPIGGRTQRVLDANQPGPVAQPELLQQLSVDIVAPGEVSALVFDPARLTADVRLVNTAETKEIFLDNVSDADLRYQLLYKEEFLPDTVSSKPVLVVSEVMQLVPAKSFGTALLKGAYDHCLFCESPAGVIPARSRVRVVFTYQPKKSGLFEFMIFAQVQAITDPVSAQPVMLSNDEAVLLRTSQNERLDNKNVSFDMNSTVNVATLPLMANITARAAFPKLLFEDIRTDSSDMLISDIEHLWKRFSFAPMNYDLSVPMTAEEVKLNNSSTPDLSVLTRYTCEFSPAVVNSPLQKVVIQLRNNGYLTTAFHLHLPNESTLELEQWCDEDEPSEELNRLVCIIEELKLFTIEPRHAVLQPGEVCTLSLSYSHTSLKYSGLHNLPVLVKLSQGKQFYINLIGHTLPAPQAIGGGAGLGGNPRRSAGGLSTAHSVVTTATTAPPASRGGALANVASNLSDILLVVCTGADKIVRLAPVPTGLSPLLAPRQRTELINVSGASVNYEVDLGPLSQLNEEHFHQPLIRVANPTGVIAASSSVFLEWYFYPLQARSYEFALNVKYFSAAPPAPYFPPQSGNMSPPKSSATSRRNSSSSLRLKTERSIHSAMQPGTAAAVTAPITYQYLNCVMQATGYDPRDPRPIQLESLYEGGLPPARPVLQLPSQCVILSHDLLDLEIVPQHCTARRVVTLRNLSETAVFEFVVDESSCILCIDGLLSVSPTFGKVEPCGSVVLDFCFVADTQPLAFEENIKIMVREIIKNVSNRRGGVKHLLDRIKSKKTTSTEHESVVSRPTMSRTIQMDNHELIPAHKKASYPVTVNASGAVVSFSKSANFAGGEVPDRLASAGGDMSVMGNFSEFGGASYNKITETDVPNSPGNGRVKTNGNGGNFGGMGNGNVHRSVSAGSRMGPQTGESGRSRLNSGGSEASSRNGGGMTPFTRDSSRSQGGGGDAPATLLGTASVLIVRLRGEVHTIETTRSIIERLDAETGSRKNVMEGFVIPETQLFIPPVGKRREDPDIIAANQKARVNIAFVKGRDSELRDMTSLVMDAMLKEILTSSSARDTLSNTITGKNPQSIATPSFPSSNSRTKTTYGVYYNEILKKQPLGDRLVVELQKMGYQSLVVSPAAQNALKADMAELDKLPRTWASYGDVTLLSDKDTFSILLSDLRGVLESSLGITRSQCAALHKEVETSMLALARNVEGGAESVLDKEGVVVEDRNMVNVLRWVRSLSRETADGVNRRVCKLHDKRKAAEIAARNRKAQPVVEVAPENVAEEVVENSGEVVPSVEVDSPLQSEDPPPVTSTPSPSELDPSMAPLQLTRAVTARIPRKQPVSQTYTAMSQPGFLEVASEVLSSAMLDLLRDMLWDEDQAGKPVVQELVDSD